MRGLVFIFSRMKLLDSEIQNYCEMISSKPSAFCEKIAEITRATLPNHGMLIGTHEASFLRLLIKILRAKRVLEFGCFTGYSALAMAEVLPSDGELITLDVNSETTQIGKKIWAESPHGKKIKLIIGDALESLNTIEGNFDLFFVDADKENYPRYVDWAIQRLKPGAVIVCDNMLWSGRVLHPENETASETLNRLNRDIAKREDVVCSLVPIRDGMLLISLR